MLAARFHGKINRECQESSAGPPQKFMCNPQHGIAKRRRTSNPNSSERRILMFLADLFGSLGGIEDFLAPLIGVIEAILNLFSGFFGGLGV